MKKLVVLFFIMASICGAIYINLIIVCTADQSAFMPNKLLFNQDIKIPLVVNASGYCPCEICCGKKSDANYGRTSSGVMAMEGVTIASDNSFLPVGSRLSIYGKDTYIVQDKGGAIKDNKIDIYYLDHNSAFEFGRQELVVYWILEKNWHNINYSLL